MSMISYFFKFIVIVLYHIIKKPRIYLNNDIPVSSPSIYIANHEKSYGPIIIYLYFPKKMYPWVINDITEKYLCRKYVKKDFIDKEMHIPFILSKVIAFMIELFCIRLMKYINAIPVYRKSLMIEKTIDISIAILASGNSLLIFPENNDIDSNDDINAFHHGFTTLARDYYQKYKINLRFIPIAINKRKRFIKEGSPVIYSADNIFINEKFRITNLLRKKIKDLYYS